MDSCKRFAQNENLDVGNDFLVSRLNADIFIQSMYTMFIHFTNSK